MTSAPVTFAVQLNTFSIGIGVGVEDGAELGGSDGKEGRHASAEEKGRHSKP